MRARSGFTIIEILLALLLLSFTLMAFQAATGQIIHYAAKSDRQTVAVQLAEDRLARIQMDPSYELLEARYEGAEDALDGISGLIRTTSIARTIVAQSTGVLDFQRITVTVTGDGLQEPVARTVVVAAP